MVAGVTIAAGVLLRVLGKGAEVVNKNRCRVCKTPIPAGAIYCRAHLRSILHDEEDKTHSTRVRR
jgi:predicted nucleic acid-binding Zn ribbon protein